MSPRRSWDSPNPSLASECAPPPRTGGGTLAAGEGLGESQFWRLEKKLSTLHTLWASGSDMSRRFWILYSCTDTPENSWSKISEDQISCMSVDNVGLQDNVCKHEHIVFHV
jgi:hypothetical protein